MKSADYYSLINTGKGYTEIWTFNGMYYKENTKLVRVGILTWIKGNKAIVSFFDLPNDRIIYGTCNFFEIDIAVKLHIILWRTKTQKKESYL